MLQIYTDGCYYNGIAYAVTLILEDDSTYQTLFATKSPTSNIFAEIQAITQGLEWVFEQRPIDTPVIVYTDSKSSIDAVIGSAKRRSHIFDQLVKLCEEHPNVALKYVRTHSAISTINSACDKLAYALARQEYSRCMQS